MIEAFKRIFHTDRSTRRPIVTETRFLSRKLKTLGYDYFREGCWLSRDKNWLAVTWRVDETRSAYYVVPNPHRVATSVQRQGRMVFQPFRSPQEVAALGEAAWIEADEAFVSTDGCASCKVYDDDGKGGFRWCLALPGKWRFV